MNQELNQLLAKAGLRVTRPRMDVFNALQQSDKPLSIVDITAACPTVDKVSVYRTMEVFTRLHVVSLIPHGWKHLYELSAPFAPHHHHLVCDLCSSLTEIHSKKLEQMIASLTEQHGFVASGHHFEITGTCKDCMAGPKA